MDVPQFLFAKFFDQTHKRLAREYSFLGGAAFRASTNSGPA